MVGNLVVVVLISLIAVAFRAETFNPYTLIVALGAMWLVAGGATAFQSVGIWRSAARYRREKPQQRLAVVWSLAAQAVAALWVIALVVPLVQSGVPRFREAWRMAFLGDPEIPDYSLRIMRGGSEAEIAGGFKYGLARDAAKVFAAAPDLKVVHLNSGGGRLGEAQALARLIRSRGLATYTSASCSSACTLAFLAGQERSLKQGAHLGFHHESFAGSEAFDSMRGLLRDAGLPSWFIDRAVAASATTMWYPTVEELTQAHVITSVVDSYRFAPSGLGVHPDTRDFEEQLGRTPLFAAIEVGEPAAFRAIVDTFHRGYVEGVPEGRILDDLRTSRIAPLILAHMTYADDQLLADYASLMADQYEAIGQRDSAACFQYAAKGSAGGLVNFLPDSLKARELALSEAVLRSTVRRKPATQPVQDIYRLIFEKLAAQFGDARVRILSDPSKVQPSQYTVYCNLAVALFREIAALPTEQSGAVMSQIFAATRGNK